MSKEAKEFIDKQLASLKERFSREVTTTLEYKVRRRVAEILNDEFLYDEAEAIQLATTFDLSFTGKPELTSEQLETLAFICAKRIRHIERNYRELLGEDEYPVTVVIEAIKRIRVRIDQPGLFLFDSCAGIPKGE